MRMAIIALAATAAAAVGTVAIAAKPDANLPPAPPSGAALPKGQCFRTHDIRNHTVVDGRTLLINVNQRDVYRLTMRGSCLAGAISTDPIITREPPGTQIVCRPIDLDLGIAKSGFETRCIIDSIDKLGPQQLAAVPKKLRP